MIRRLRTAAVALALLVLGLAGMGAPFAGYPALDTTTASFPGASADTLRFDPVHEVLCTDGARTPDGAVSGNGRAVAGEDNPGDDSQAAAIPATAPRDRAFAAAFHRDQDVAQPSFLAPPTRGPPAA